MKASADAAGRGGQRRRFEGVSALVTGAGGGIGEGVVRAVVAEGARVIATDRDSSLLASYDDAADAVDPCVMDVCDPGSVAGVFERAGRNVSVLVNCAGVRDIGPTETLDVAAWERTLAVNLTGTFLPCQAFIRSRLAAGALGAIVNLASTAGCVGIPERAAYVAAKHGVVGLTKALAVEFASRGIRVNAVAPGVIRTAMTERYFAGDGAIDRLKASHPLGGYGEVEDVTAAILFLASAESRFATGAVLSVDGGFVAGKVI